MLCIAWTRVTSYVHLYFGQDPTLGVYHVLGTNETPFTDRSFICVRRGRVYKPMQLQQALESSVTAVVVNSSGSAVSGFRMMKRTQQLSGFSDSAMSSYQATCEAIASTMDTIFDRCEDLGYNVNRGSSLRIVENTTVKLLSDTLPVVAIPFFDNSFHARYTIPGWNGSACMFRLSGAYETQGDTELLLNSVNRSVRELKTAEWLGKPGGVWRNGWYEDLEGDKWFADMLSTQSTSLGIVTREFDMQRNSEHDCKGTSACENVVLKNDWGARLSSVTKFLASTSVTILNERHDGVFLLDASTEQSIESVYDLEMILANASFGALLVHWLVAKIALLRSYRSGETELQSVGIGVLSCARGFHLLPLFLLPRLKTNLAVFATVGCTYDGAQLALSQAWFLMYPGIAELLFFVYSLLNLIAKLLRRRMSDMFFGPTLLFFCLLHYSRISLAQSGWLEYDGRLNSVLSSEDFDRLTILDFFRNNTLLKLNGNVKSLFLIKIGVLSLNLLPLLCSNRTSDQAEVAPPTTTEASLALRIASSGGLRSSPLSTTSTVTKSVHSETAKGIPVISSFELLHLGFLVIGDKWLVSITDWHVLAITAPVARWRLVPMRVMLFAVKYDAGQDCYYIEQKPLLCQISDPRIADCRPWKISTRAFR